MRAFRVACVVAVFSAAGVFAVGPALSGQDLGGWKAPEGGWDYVYEANEGEDVDGEFDFDFAFGNSLDGTWTHNNGSDAWDGSGPGDEFRPDGFTPAAPGGAGIVIRKGMGEEGGDAEVLSIVDTGDPRPRGFSDPSNRKMWFCHDVAQEGVIGEFALRDGLTLIVRSRLHPDVDPETPGWQLPDGGVDNDAGQGAAPGYALRDGGKGGHGYYDAGLDRNFSFVPFGTNGYQFPPQVGEGLEPENFLDVGDNTVFHSFWINISDEDGNDRYDVIVYVDGSIEPAAEFLDIPLGDDTDCDGISHLHMGLHSTPQVGGMEIDYFGYKIGPVEPPTSTCPGGLTADFDTETGQVTLSWSPGAVDSYTIRRNGTPIAEGLSADTTTFTDTDPARPSATYELVGIAGGDPAPCPVLSATVPTVVCPELTCSADKDAGTVTLEWTDPKFVTPTGFRILRDGMEVGTAAADARSFTDSPPPGEYTYELALESDVEGACAVRPFCETRLFAPGSIEIKGDTWDRVVVNGLAQIAVTNDGVKSLYFPPVQKSTGDVAAFAVQVADLGAGGGAGAIGGGRFRVEIRARFSNEVRIVNRSVDPESFVHFDLARTGVSQATDDTGVQEAVEQVPDPPGGSEVESTSSTIVNTETVGLVLEEGLNLIEIQAADAGGTPHDDQVQIFELRIGPFAEGLQAELTEFPCASGLSCRYVEDCAGEAAVELSWNSAFPHAYEIERDGELIAEIPKGNTTSFTDTPEPGVHTYTLRVTDSEICPDLTCTVVAGVPDADGFIRDWLILGPLDWGCVTGGFRRCDAPGEQDIQGDYLAGTSDGEAVDEQTILPTEGQTIELGPQATVRDAPRSDINPGRPESATWFAYRSPVSAIDANVVFGGDPGNDYMLYGVTYVVNTSGEEKIVTLGVASDDSVQVYVNDESVWTNNVARGLDLLNLDFVFNVVLLPGINRILVKVFEGGGGTGFAVRLQDDFGIPNTEGLEVTLCPEVTPPPPEEVFVRGDSDGNGKVELTDAVRVLAFLFQGGAALECEDAGDADDNAALEITDAIRILQWLFVTPDLVPLPPSPSTGDYPASDCGPDPTPDDLGCAANSKCMPGA